MKERVLVAMSGGVDSSISAFLLKEKGYDVYGITMCFGVKDIKDEKPRCCGPQAIEDAKRVCDKLKISHYVMDFSKELEEKVIDNFISQYLKGRTPNPCVECNKFIKFGSLLEKALSLDFNFLATGHYAKIEKSNGNYFLKKARDKKKDQSYFLYPIKKEFLKYILFPLADLTKEEVRELAEKINLSVYNKPQSQDICFIPDRNYRKFLEKRIKTKPGPILDLRGNILGEHKGIFSYTIGQREGLGISFGEPLYVIEIKPEENQIIVGERKDLRAGGLVTGEINILVENLPKETYAKIRYTSKEAKCYLEKSDGKIKIIFEKEQSAVTPGQSAVLYNKDLVLGGGIIEEVIR
jgi:tRNA-specific 2-thiouridylase